ncbi:cell wall metabolism sensor histidine kinase WalK [Saccharibacillus sp. JS10]|uniref:sensor histidine kinase n=1 Tax=Saccharibacillus sp. JS10 TaxID=2950552 RepID=UPI002109A376|nr:HAMP domain-containing sensor histidine kinase [Saccharibacillus sp. JS10]MCQ4085287.1 HAMP domain-containing histidine kinase [Saccharibacillus sp. JS10]
MKKNSVTTKLFIATASIFILFYIIVLLAQLLVFPQFYEKRKITKLQQGTNQLAEAYREDPNSLLETDSDFLVSLRRSDVNFALTDLTGDLPLNDPFRIQIQRADGTKLQVSLSYLVISSRGEFDRLKLDAGESVQLYGDFGQGADRDTFYAFYIGATTGQGIEGKEAGDRSLLGTTQRIEGKLLTTKLPDTDKLGRRLGLVYLALDEFFPLKTEDQQQLRQMQPVQRIWIDSFSGNRSAIRLQPVQDASGELQVLLVVTSLQEIKETNSALRLFFVYLGVGGFILILFLSILYSGIVTRPLVKLNQKAQRMKLLDFSQEEPLKRKDELGSLSNTLFELSSQLGVTLDELGKTNFQLKKEIEHNKELEQLQKDFFANASHELKTPLSIVKGFAEGMQDGIGAGRQDHYIGVILEESEKMERLVQDMLELLRLDSQTLKLYKTPVLLSELTEDVLEKLVYQMREKKLSAQILKDNEQPLSLDAGKMEQVVLNLLTNAIRHAAPGSTIQINISYEHDRSTYTIHNQGSSIPEDYLNRIWERFFRVEAARDRATGGTGLGLAIVKRILELHDCEYKVENVNEGVKFTLVFRV